LSLRDQAAAPEPCETGSTTTSSNANVLIAVVQVDKDSTLIRQDYSDGSARFTIIDNSEIAGEVYAGVKAKVAKYGINYALSADAGLGLEGAREFFIQDPDDADDFQERVQAAGGFDGILRDISHSNGAFVPERVGGAPVRIAAGEQADLAIEGRVDGCRFGPQSVPLAGPELELRVGDDERTQALGLDIRVELKTEDC